MNCRRIKFYIMVLVLLFAPQPRAFAQNLPGCDAELDKIFPIQGTITNLETLKASEFIGAQDVQQVGNQLDNQQDLLAIPVPSFQQSITRKIEAFWRMRVKNSDFQSLGSKNATYEVINESDKVDGSPFNKVNINPEGTIREVLPCAEDTTIIEGGITLVFTDLSKIRVTKDKKRFQGKIKVCVPIKTSCP